MKTSVIASAITAILLAVHVSAQPIDLGRTNPANATVIITHNTAVTLGLNERQELKLYRLNLKWAAACTDRYGRTDWESILAHRYAEYTRDLSRILNNRQLRQWRAIHESGPAVPVHKPAPAPPRPTAAPGPRPVSEPRPVSGRKPDGIDKYDKPGQKSQQMRPDDRPDSHPDNRPQTRPDNRKRKDHGNAEQAKEHKPDSKKSDSKKSDR